MRTIRVTMQGTTKKIMLDELETQARAMGVAEDKIIAARAASERNNNDDAFRDLLLPLFLAKIGEFK